MGHRVATDALASGGNPRAAQQMLGWSRGSMGKMLKRYTNPVLQEIALIIAKTAYEQVNAPACGPTTVAVEVNLDILHTVARDFFHVLFIQ